MSRKPTDIELKAINSIIERVVLDRVGHSEFEITGLEITDKQWFKKQSSNEQNLNKVKFNLVILYYGTSIKYRKYIKFIINKSEYLDNFVCHTDNEMWIEEYLSFSISDINKEILNIRKQKLNFI